MKRKLFITAVLAAAALLNTGCGNDMETQITGKYEHPDLPGQTFEFAAGNRYVKTMKAGDTDCTIEYTGTWNVDGDSLFVENGNEKPVYHFGDSLTDAQKDIIRRLAESDLQPRLSFKIAGVDSLALSLERGGRIVTYNRVK